MKKRSLTNGVTVANLTEDIIKGSGIIIWAVIICKDCGDIRIGDRSGRCNEYGKRTRVYPAGVEYIHDKPIVNGIYTHFKKAGR